MLIYHNIFERYQQPGGHIDDNEHPWLNALRELQEETSLSEVELHSFHTENDLIPIWIDRQRIPENPKKQEGEHYHYDIRYVFVADDKQDMSIQYQEVSDSKRFRIDELEGEMKERVAVVMSRLM